MFGMAGRDDERDRMRRSDRDEREGGRRHMHEDGGPRYGRDDDGSQMMRRGWQGRRDDDGRREMEPRWNRNQTNDSDSGSGMDD
jgi:hypothetical protein